MHKWSLVLFFWLSHFFLYAQSSSTIEITYNGSDLVYYCRGAVPVAPSISVKGTGFAADNGLRVSIANFVRGEDTLFYQGKFRHQWNNTFGYIEITGTGSAPEYEEAIRNIRYRNLATKPTTGVRSVSVTLKDANYLPSTGHFYDFYSHPGIHWTAANDSAGSTFKRYYGLKGYLATIASSEENDFIWSKLTGIGWIGASDHEKEGEWKWATGPEKGSKFYDHPTLTTLPGWYSFWNTDEPNNTAKTWGSDEDYAHINMSPASIPHSWNDLSNESDGPSSAYFYSQGYIVEYGGMEGDPVLKLSASVKLLINKIAFSGKREFEICQGASQVLNEGMNTPAVYSWTPATYVSDPAISTPSAFPDVTTTFRVIGENGEFCRDTAYFNVKVKPAPVTSLADETVVCGGGEVVLDPGKHKSYIWSNSSTANRLTAEKEGWYRVSVTNEFNCAKADSTRVRWCVKPIVTLGGSPLICGRKYSNIHYSFDRPVSSLILTSLSPKAFIIQQHLDWAEIWVNEFGKYDFRMQLTDPDGCSFSDTLSLEFHNLPRVEFNIDSMTCYGYNLKLISKPGNTIETALFTWYSSDTVFATGTDLKEIEIPLGFGQGSKNVGLEINELGCETKKTENVRIKPTVNFSASPDEGCSPLGVQFFKTGPGQISRYDWEFGNGKRSGDSSPVTIFENRSDKDTTFRVNVRIESTEGCKNEGFLPEPILVHPLPTAGFDIDPEKCFGDTIRINYRGTGTDKDTYTWTIDISDPREIITHPGSTRGPLVVSTAIKPAMNAGIQVQSRYGCKSGYVQERIKFSPSFRLPPDTVRGCPPLNASFSVIPLRSKDEITYRWDLGDGTEATGETVSHPYSLPDRYYNLRVTGFSQITGCSDTLMYKNLVRVFPVPVADFKPVPDAVPISSPGITFTNLSTAASRYEWDFGDKSPVSALKDPLHRYSEMGYFNVRLTSYNLFECTDSVSKRVAVIFDRLFPPNAFSPNSPNEVDRIFRIFAEGVASEGYALEIYNRWGEKIHETTDPQSGWDGKMKNGSPSPAGAFNWLVRYLDLAGQVHRQQGNVVLLY